ncbi:MAG: hypothetical protein FD123_1712 [Bacteroidetes bacterium]|nr:MAG: hypothetical protein FD123_1712 [Bacteroidota bacterium]
MKKSLILAAGLLAASFTADAQVQLPDSVKGNQPLNTASSIVAQQSSRKVTFGCYGQMEFNQQFNDSVRHNGLLDVHRLVTFFGYKFNDRTDFVTEVEFEHVNEAAVEQAFVNYRVLPWMSVRAGLLLIPMGIINEYHEPTTFNGSSRPNLDKSIVPATWREMGAGITGSFSQYSLRYQLYTVNGFSGYNGGGKLGGADGLRGGRQKAIKSFITAPDYSAKLDYYAVPGLKIGLSGYFGESESKLKDGLLIDDSTGTTQARLDSSMVGISMLGVDVRYQFKGIEARAQYNLSNLSNTGAYNKFTGKDLGAKMNGFYVEAGYNFLQPLETEKRLVLFARYEDYDTHAAVTSEITRNKAYHRSELITGIGFWPAQGAVFKADYQYTKTAADNDVPKHFINLGVGVWF